MNEFIKAYLNRLGFGINGVMTGNPKMFGGRMEDYFPPFKVTLDLFSEGHCIYLFSNDKGDKFYAEYHYDPNTGQIKELDIYENYD